MHSFTLTGSKFRGETQAETYKLFAERLAIERLQGPKVGGQRVIAALVHGHRYVSRSNTYQTHPWVKRLLGEDWAGCMHAEVAALLAGFRAGFKAEESVLLVVRVGRTREGEVVVRDAKPCRGCWEAIKISGVTKVIWTREIKL